MTRPRLLDLFCGAGGAAVGYHRAGFDVVGVDIAPQPHYPFEFVQADALTLCQDRIEGCWHINDGVHDASVPCLGRFDAVHASPPCQHYSLLAAMHPDREWPDLIPPTRARLSQLTVPWVMENVEAAPMLRAAGLFGIHGIRLCGTAFGLGARGMELRRHRLFESNVPLSGRPCRHRLRTIGVYGHGGHKGKHRMAHAHEARECLGIDWMNRDEMCEAIPPAYTEWVGRQLLAHVGLQA